MATRLSKREVILLYAMYIIILTRKFIGNNVDDNASRIFNTISYDTRASAKPREHKKNSNLRGIKTDNLSFNTCESSIEL